MENIFIKHWRLASLVLGAVIVLWVLYLLKAAILPFVAGLVLAYLFMPFVSWLERKLPRPGKWSGFKRVFSVFLVFLILICLVGGFAYFIVTAVVDATIILLEGAPDILSRSIFQIGQWLEGLKQQFPPEVGAEVDKALLDAGKSLGISIRDAILGGISFAPRTLGAVFGFAVLPFFLFYVMKDSEKLKRGMASAMTPAAATHARNIASIVERVLGGYIRAQLMLGLIVAYFAFVGLLILKIRFAPALALLAGLTELIPLLGPWIGGITAVLVTLAIAPEKAIWVAVLFVSIQVVENNFLVPRIQSAYLHIHPAVMIVLLVLGAYIAGFWGLLLAGPLTATAVEIYKYVHKQYRQLEYPG